MAALSIRDLDDDQGRDLFSALLNRFDALGGVVLEVPGREHSGRPVELSE